MAEQHQKMEASINIFQALGILAILSGFWVLYSDSWSFLYKGNLFLHPLLGILWAVGLYLNLRRSTPRKSERRAWWKLISFSLILTLILAILRGRWPHPVWGWVLIGLYPAFHLRSAGKNREQFLALCAIYYSASIAFSGAVFAAALGGRTVKSFLLLHRITAQALVVVLLLWWMLYLLRAVKTKTALLELLKKKAKVAAVILPVLVLVAVAELLNPVRQPYYRFHLSTYTIEQRGPHEQDVLPTDFKDHYLATRTESCGGPGCHQPLLEDMKVSNHGTSMFTPHMQKNMALLSEEIGKQNQITCGGCHYPRAMFDRSVPMENSYKELNYSCTFCHLIDSVNLWEDRRKSEIAVRLHLPHLQMFDQGGRDEISALNRVLVNFNPFGHGRVFTKPLYFEDAYCQVCHRLQIQPTTDTPLVKPKCIDCHMQARNKLGLEGKQRNHIFPGTNTVNPQVLAQPEMLAKIRDYAEGRLPFPIKGWGSFWEPRDQQKEGIIWVLQKAMPLTDPIPGQDFTLRFVTINASLDHVFPAGPLDLVETWHKVTVWDQDGTELFHVGDLDEQYKIDPRAHRMGGYMMGVDGRLVERNRVWQIKQKMVTRAVPFHYSTYDDYTFRLPERVTTLRVEAQWMYRKLNQEFMDWAYGAGRSTAPVIVASELKAVIPLQ